MKDKILINFARLLIAFLMIAYVLSLSLWGYFVLAEAGIIESGNWRRECAGDLILSESTWGWEVWVFCDNPSGKDWQRGCYGVVSTYATPGMRHASCKKLILNETSR